MIRGIYIGASGMLAEMVRTDAISNNLANVNTAGYKKDATITKDFASVLTERINDGNEPAVIGNRGVGVAVDEIATIHTPGAMTPTGNTFDLAVEGPGFFTVQTPTGIRYTRNGAFTKNAAGQLVTNTGNLVLDTNQRPISVDGNKITIGANGIVNVDGVEAGQLGLVQFPNLKQLQKEGDSLFSASNDATMQPAQGRVQQGFLEQSNVNVVMEMVNLISNYRAYEINGKVVQSHDQTLDKAVNEVAKV